MNFVHGSFFTSKFCFAIASELTRKIKKFLLKKLENFRLQMSMADEGKFLFLRLLTALFLLESLCQKFKRNVISLKSGFLKSRNML